MCLPKAAGGLNITNLSVWNKAAIVKVAWDLTQKADKLWIKWIHTYYIKNQHIGNATGMSQASWMVQKVFQGAGHLASLQINRAANNSIIRQIYLQQLGLFPKVEWRSLMLHNCARPTALFTLWIYCHGRLLTRDRLKEWGMQVDEFCLMCKADKETKEHLFYECQYAEELWVRLQRWLQLPLVNHATWSSFHTWNIQRTKGKSQQAMLYKMVYTEYIYMLWIERNTRKVQDRPRDPAKWNEIADVAAALSIPVIANGDVFEYEDFQRIRDATGASSVMAARGALWNASIFSPKGKVPWEEVKRDYVRKSILWDNDIKSTKHTLKEMIMYYSGLGRPEGQAVIKSDTLADLAKLYGEENYYDYVSKSRRKQTISYLNDMS